LLRARRLGERHKRRHGGNRQENLTSHAALPVCRG
jgi:hypothetical protein